MAGFDFQVYPFAEEVGFYRVLFKRFATVHKAAGAELHYRKWRSGYTVVVDGRLGAMYRALTRCVLEVDAIVDTYSELTLKVRREIGNDVVNGYWDAYEKLRDSNQRMIDEFGMGEPRGDEFIVGDAAHLKERARSLSSTVTGYYLGWIPAGVLAEEIHTAVETMGRSVLGDDAPYKFDSVVDALVSHEMIYDSVGASVKAMKVLRVDAKHKGGHITDDDLQPLMPDLLNACHELALVAKLMFAKEDDAIVLTDQAAVSH